MGRGDKRTFKGKVFRGSFGKSRPRTDKKTTGMEASSAAASTPASKEQQQRRK
jgi:30S ribosomal protein S31